MEVKLTKTNLEEIVAKVKQVIKDGGVATLPFDTVYGFACDPRSDSALEKLFSIKKRPLSLTIGIATVDIESAKQIADISDENEQFISEKIPGPYTFILPVADKSISRYCKRGDTVGLRIPDNDLVQEVARLCDGAIAQTSANLSGQSECYSIKDLKAQYDNNDFHQIDLIIDRGEIKSAGASRIFDLTGDTPKEINRK